MSTHLPATRTWLPAGLLHAACLCAALLAMAWPLPAQPPGVDAPYTPPLQRAVPIALADGALIVEGSVSNFNAAAQPPAPFVLDSAAITTIVPPQTARALGSMGAVRGASGNQLRDKSLRMAGAEISRRPVLVYSLRAWARQTGLPVGGIAGADIFSHFGVRIDYADSLLTLLVPQSCTTSTPRMPLHIFGGLPFVDAELAGADGKPVRGLFLLDTAQTGPGLVLTPEFLAAHSALAGSQPGAEIPMLEPNSMIRNAGVARIASLVLGAYTLHNVVATVAAPSPQASASQLAGVIGGGVLARFSVLVDMPHAAISLAPNAHFPDPFEADMSGMLLLASDAGEHSGERGYTIAGISKNSPAADSGLREGDQLIEVAQQKVADMSLELVRNVFKSGAGTRVLVSVDRSGKRVQVTLTLRRAV